MERHRCSCFCCVFFCCCCCTTAACPLTAAPCPCLIVANKRAGGFKGEVWIAPGEEPTQGALYRRLAEGAAEPSLSLVLGAGNQMPVVAGEAEALAGKGVGCALCHAGATPGAPLTHAAPCAAHCAACTPPAPGDILHQLFVENAVVVCKMNPANEYLGPFIR